MDAAVIQHTAVMIIGTRGFHIHFHSVCDHVGDRKRELKLVVHQILSDIFL